MAVYILMEVKVKNQKKYSQYLSAFSDIVTNYGGHCLVDEGRITPLDEGIKLERRHPERIVIMEFPSAVNVRRCLASPEYQEILELRQAGASTRTVMLEMCKA